jgi:hypothetical protein
MHVFCNADHFYSYEMNLINRPALKNKPVTVYIDGGLGNQMFQYAFGRTIADIRSSPLYLDCALLTQIRRGVTQRMYSLNCFNVRAEIISRSNPGIRFKFWLLKIFPFVARILSIKIEDGRNFQVQPACDSSVRYLKGYWQSHLFFSENAERIFNDFSPKTRLSCAADEFVKLIKSTQAVMIHVRRGDYVSSKSASSYHSLLDVAYYRSAFNEACAKVENPLFFIFSDDIEWCKQALSFIDKQAYFIAPGTFMADWEDLTVMSFCRHQIIANSSFSWWSAWLADRRFGTKGRFVWAPLKWFARDTIIASHRFPPHWEII